MSIDLVLINPGNRKETFQSLGEDLSAIEPPFLIVSIATYLRNNDINVKIIDSNALNIRPEETAQLVKDFNPLLCSVIVYGGQPSASTQTMGIAGDICKAIKNVCDVPVSIGGLHPSALPKRTLEEESVDFVIEGEEQIPLQELVRYAKGECNLSEVRGIWYKKDKQIVNNPKPPLIEDLDKYLPIAA